MKAFDYINAKSVEEATGLLPKHEGDERTRLIAGGQDILTELKEHLIEPDTLVNLKQIEGLDGLEWAADGSLTIGALTRLEDLAQDERLRASMTLVAEAAESIASPQIRSQATIGGNLNQRPRCWYYRNESTPCLKKGGDECFAYEGRNKYNAILGGGPSYIVHPSDLAPALVAVGATVSLSGPKGERTLPLADFFTLPATGNILRETVLAPNEILTRVHVPAPASGMRSTYLKFKERSSYDFALSAVAICLWQTDGKIDDARIVLGGVAPKPWDCQDAAAAITGRKNDMETRKLAGEAALKGAEPLGENAFKVPLTKGLIARAMEGLS
ncbi:MAG: xanthine dehydrogenase YagS FAD-binding subunit [Planctomycetota bacterium]|jgi:xanthine dehydrogenase YagS FAD-binding subunit